MDTRKPEQEVCVKAAVGLWQTEEQEKIIQVNEDCKSLIFRDKNDTETKEYHFTFDGVFSFNAGQDKVFVELIQSMLNTVSSGYNVSILVYGSHGCGSQFLHGEDGNQFGLLYQTLEQVFQGVQSIINEEYLITAAFMQFNPDGKAMDLLNACNEDLAAVYISDLGMAADGASEIIVTSPADAYSLYLGGKEQLEDKNYSTLFKLILERSMAGDETGTVYVRSVVKIFELNQKSLQASENVTWPLLHILEKPDLERNERLLPLLLKEALDGNTYTLLIACINAQELSGKEIVSALSVADRVRGLSKKVSANIWDPEAAAQKLRRQIKSQRSKLLSDNMLEESAVRQLAEAVKELQMVKKQMWKEKTELSKKLGIKKICDHEECHHCTCSKLSEDTNESNTDLSQHQRLINLINQSRKEQIGEDGQLDGIDVYIGEKNAAANFGDGGAKMEKSGCRHQHTPPTVTTKRPSVESFGMELEFSMARARREWLKEQHRALIHKEMTSLKHDECKQESVTPEQEIQQLKKEKTVLVFQLEALRRERNEAEKDLELLCQFYKEEVQVQKQHILEIFHAYRGSIEEQMDSQEHRYRKLLEEAIEDAIQLSARNQELEAENKQLQNTITEMQSREKKS